MTSFVEDPGRLRDLAARIRAKEVSPVELVQRCLDRIDEVQPLAEPWREVDGEQALAVAHVREQQALRGEVLGPLHGIPFGVKDIIDVEGLPSRCNCQALEDRRPAQADAAVVQALKAGGAIALGKLHTTEFAFFDPSPARNPYNTAHTPGGSSSGSGAAVAAGTVPMSLGTQTMASLNRPAAYCGVSAFKPSSRSISTYGVSPLAPTFDTVGFYGWSVDDAVYAYEAAMDRDYSPLGTTIARDDARVIVIEDELIADMSEGMRRAFMAKRDQLDDAGCRVETASAPVSFKRLGELHWNIMAYETGRSLAHVLDYPADKVGERIRNLIAEGQARPTETYFSERAELAVLQRQFFDAFDAADGFLWPAAPGPAPEGLTSTGDPRYIAPWTALGGPIITLPAGLSDGMPVGCILGGAPGSDHALGDVARRIEA